MEIYEIEKNLFQRTEDCLTVLSWKNDPIPASRVRNEWSYHVEIQIEPTGWQGLWKIPRAICEELKIKYPTFVFGMIQQVLFKELKAIFEIIAVQDEIQLPEEQEIHLEDIWVTKAQENTAMNIERTAEVLDSLRFFYNQIWMPWDNDNDDDLDWADKHLNSRIRFYYDLKNNYNMSRNLASHIKMLLIEARHIQERREYLELDFSDDDDEPNDIIHKKLNKNEISDLMKLHLRLSIIRNEVEILENPEMRIIYDEFKFGENKMIIDKGNSKVFIVAVETNLSDHIKLMQSAEKYISNNQMVKICSTLQDALNICNSSDTILLSPGQHYIKFLNHMNGNGQIIGLSISNDNNNNLAEITCNNEFISNVLFIFNGGFTLKNLILNCNSIRTGILLKTCNNVNLENCKIIGNKNFSTSQAIILTENSKLSMSDCLIENFSTGVKLNDSSKLILNNSIIKKCHTGLEIHNDGKVEFSKNEIIDSKNYGILWKTVFAENSKKEIFENFSEIKMENVEIYPWNGNCLFGNNKGNIAIMDTEIIAQKSILENSLVDNLEESVIFVDDSDSQSLSFEECVNVEESLLIDG